jgi:hypothetical protein
MGGCYSRESLRRTGQDFFFLPILRWLTDVDLLFDFISSRIGALLFGLDGQKKCSGLTTLSIFCEETFTLLWQEVKTMVKTLCKVKKTSPYKKDRLETSDDLYKHFAARGLCVWMFLECKGNILEEAHAVLAVVLFGSNTTIPPQASTFFTTLLVFLPSVKQLYTLIELAYSSSRDRRVDPT